MNYPNLLEERLRNRIAKLKKQNRMLHAGAIEAVITQNYKEMQELQQLLAASTTDEGNG